MAEKKVRQLVAVMEIEAVAWKVASMDVYMVGSLDGRLVAE